MRIKYRIRPEVIDQVRERHGFTSDEQLGAYLGVTGATVHRIRKGESPNFSTAIRLLMEAGVLVEGVEEQKSKAAA